MKKTIILLISLAIIALLGWYTIGLFENKGKSDTELIEFSVADTASVNQVIITDAFSNKIELVRTETGWTDSEGSCITQENVEFILDAIKNIEFKGYLTEGSQKQFTNLMAAMNTKVEIYQDGDWVKTWYIGPPSQDHYGQIMLLETEEGKSAFPVMMRIKGMNGIIEPRFYADKRKWMCTNIFAVPIENIRKVDVKFYEDPIRSFTVNKNGNSFSVYQQNRKLPQIDTAMVFRYLQNYKKIHFDLANYELTDKQVDSVKHRMPFATLTLSETSGKVSKLRMFRIKSEEPMTNEFGEVVNIDMNKFWCELPNGQLVKCQYFVFNPLLLGHIYFPMDVSSLMKEQKGSSPAK